ncbi:MAG: glycosyltransferase [Pseudomonadota bacterium]
MTSWIEVSAVLSALIWLYLWRWHGRFWRLSECLDEAAHPPTPSGPWPSISVVVPARNEASTIERTVAALIAQRYPGHLRIAVVDDASDDDTAARVESFIASGAADRHPHRELTLLRNEPLPVGWVGKMWAVETGVAHATANAKRPDFLLLTDADLELHPNCVAHLVGIAHARQTALTSLMVYLTHGRGWPRLLIPAFVYFFKMLYPFSWVNDPARRTAAAAGGCMLVNTKALQQAGGIDAIRDELIDDCALAAALKPGRAIWLGEATHSCSIRPYESLGPVWQTVVRSAFVQLRYSWTLLILTTMGMWLLYLAPLLAVSMLGSIAAWVSLLGVATWAVQARTFSPMVRFYHQPRWLAALLPLAGAIYLVMTWHSALRHVTGRGVQWRGRVTRT